MRTEGWRGKAPLDRKLVTIRSADRRANTKYAMSGRAWPLTDIEHFEPPIHDVKGAQGFWNYPFKLPEAA